MDDQLTATRLAMTKSLPVALNETNQSHSRVPDIRSKAASSDRHPNQASNHVV